MKALYDRIAIIHSPTKTEPFLILDKPRGLPSAPLFEGDESALTYAIEKFPYIKNVTGKKEIEYGLVHRIDTETKGLLLIALTQEFYDFILAEQTNGRFIKTYEAVCDSICIQDELEGFPQLDYNLEDIRDRIQNLTNESSFSIGLTTRFRPFGLKNKEVRPVNQFAGKAAEKKASPKNYSTEITLIKKEDGIHAKCTIKEGYRHQVRCHLAWLGLPIKGDIVYNPKSTEEQNFQFTAIGLDFSGYSFSLK